MKSRPVGAKSSRGRNPPASVMAEERRSASRSTIAGTTSGPRSVPSVAPASTMPLEPTKAVAVMVVTASVRAMCSVTTSGVRIACAMVAASAGASGRSVGGRSMSTTQ